MLLLPFCNQSFIVSGWIFPWDWSTLKPRQYGEMMAMQFRFLHNNINVFNLEKSLQFYTEALGLREIRRKEADDGRFVLVYLSDGASAHQLELTWLRDKADPYNLGDNEIHLAFEADDFEAAHQRHREMDCICFENQQMGIYFICDPDGYWLEIMPPK